MAIGFNPQFDAYQEAAEADARDPHAPRKKAVAERKQKLRAMLGQRKSEHHAGGVVGAMDGIINFNAEALAFKALWLLGIDALIIAFNIPYFHMQQEFKVAQAGGFAYEPNANKVWPTIYKTDEKGNLDYNQPYDCEPADIPFTEIYTNGFVPAADMQRSFMAGLAELQSDMKGESSLSREQLMLLHRGPMDQNGSKNEEDGMRRQQEDAARNAAQRPVPRAVPVH